MKYCLMSEWYEEIDAIVGTRAGNYPPVILDTGCHVSASLNN
jgi:hypothetical protein